MCTDPRTCYCPAVVLGVLKGLENDRVLHAISRGINLKQLARDTEVFLRPNLGNAFTVSDLGPIKARSMEKPM